MVIHMQRYAKGEEKPERTVKHAKFSPNGEEFMVMDSNREHPLSHHRLSTKKK